MMHRAKHIGDTQKWIVQIQWLCIMYFMFIPMDLVKFSAHGNFKHCQ